MGQVFSVLVVLVGIAEVLACIEHIQHGVLPAWAPRRVITEPTKWRQKQSSCDLIIKRKDSVKDSFQSEEREKREEVEESNSQNKLELNGVGVLPHEHQNLDLVSSEDLRNEWKVSVHQQPHQNASVNELSVSCDADGILCMQQTENDVRSETADTSSVSAQVHGSGGVEHIASLQSTPQGCEEKYLVPDNKVKTDVPKLNINEEMINIIDSITNQQNPAESVNIPQNINNNKQQLTVEILENKIGEGNITKLSIQEIPDKLITKPTDDLSIKNNNIIQQGEPMKGDQILQSQIPELTMNNINNEKTSPAIDFNQTEINSQSVTNDDNFINEGKPLQADVGNIEKPHTHDLPREISRVVCKEEEEEFDVNGNTSADSVPLHVNQEPQEIAAKEKMIESLSDIPAPATHERSQDVIPPEQARQVTERITETSPELKTEEIVTSQAIKNHQEQVSQAVCDPASQIIPDTLQTTSRQDPPPPSNTPSTPPPSPTTERASSPAAATDKPSVEPPRNEHVTIPTEMKNTLWVSQCKCCFP